MLIFTTTNESSIVIVNILRALSGYRNDSMMEILVEECNQNRYMQHWVALKENV